MANNNIDYVKVIYNVNDRPFTKYPKQLTKYLAKRYDMKIGSSILDVGCGRGEFLSGFITSDLEGYGVDRSNSILETFNDIKFQQSDLEKDGIPYPDNFFEYVFSKSVIEHFYNPDNLGKEIFRVLKPGGLVITMCPSWEYNIKNYYEDYTHRSPFTKVALRDFLIIQGFTNVEVEYFRQLPILWNLNWLIIASEFTRLLIPDFIKKHSKWVRFSKEVMLLSSARKP